MTTTDLATKQYIVQSQPGAAAWFLRGVNWAGSRDRATVFASRELAEAALKAAGRFMKPKQIKQAMIYELPTD